MPIFGNKFSPKKTPARKSNINTNASELDELVSDQRVVNLKLGEQELVFNDCDWIPSSGQNSCTHRVNQKLKKKVQDLQEENNLLRVKYEIILNMLAQTTAESHIQEKEIERLRKMSLK